MTDKQPPIRVATVAHSLGVTVADLVDAAARCDGCGAAAGPDRVCSRCDRGYGAESGHANQSTLY